MAKRATLVLAPMPKNNPHQLLEEALLATLPSNPMLYPVVTRPSQEEAFGPPKVRYDLLSTLTLILYKG